MVYPRELKGLVVTLSSDGHLQCSYMGTDPSFFTAPKVDSREVNYDEVDAEMKALQKVIREATRNQGRTIIYICYKGEVFRESTYNPGHLYAHEKRRRGHCPNNLTGVRDWANIFPLVCSGEIRPRCAGVGITGSSFCASSY